MCGITGIFDVKGHAPIDRGLLARMTTLLAHRGPDDTGYHFGPGIGLGHRRLSIIDLSPLGHCPLFNEDGTVCVTFNGEIYNYVELFEELKALGHKFRSRCDTEVTVHAWEEWGEDCVQHFNGQFAFAIWDEPRQTLFLARDRFGEKPLYYTLLDDGRFLFGSELKALLADPAVRRDLDPYAVADYFSYGYVPDPRSIYRGVAKLPPAHTLTLRRGAAMPAPREYWDVTFRAEHFKSETDIADELMKRLQIQCVCRGGGCAIGHLLSGGVNSSAVVAMMAESSQAPVNTCSISFGEPEYDESLYAQQIAQRFHTKHLSRQAVVNDFELIDRLATFYDEPFADSSALPTYLVCALARERVTVALSGDGGDEIFAGYRRYYWHQKEEQVRSLVPHALRRPVFALLGAGYPKMDWAPRFLRAKSTLQNLARGSVAAYFNTICSIPEQVRQRLAAPAHRRDLQGYDPISTLQRHMKSASTEDPLAQNSVRRPKDVFTRRHSDKSRSRQHGKLARGPRAAPGSRFCAVARERSVNDEAQRQRG